MHVLISLDARRGSSQLAATPITITRTARSWHIVPEGQPMMAIAYVGRAERRSALVIRGLGSAPIEVGEVLHPGQLLLFPELDGDGPEAPALPNSFHLVEELGIETYLPGVIAKELISGWRLGTFRAQAIAARSYALHERWRSRRDARRWDLESSDADQIYAGATTNERALEAVRTTRGVVLTWEGEVLRAYYSSTSGGRSASASDVWPTGRGFEYNLARPIQGYGGDTYGQASPLNRWTVERDAKALAARLAALGRDQNLAIRSIRRVVKIEQVAHNQFGRPTRYRVTGRGGTWWELSAEELRTGCNWTGSSGLPAVTRKTRVNSGDLEASVVGDRVVLRGRGFGHGVGLCQYGAQGQAELGRPPAAILMHYYPGALLKRAYY